MQGVVLASSPVARDHWRKFELIIRENRDEGSDGKGRKAKRLSPLSPFPSHHSPPRSRSTLVPIIPLPRFSLVSRDLDLGKPVEEAGCCTVFIYFDENDSDGPSGL